MATRLRLYRVFERETMIGNLTALGLLEDTEMASKLVAWASSCLNQSLPLRGQYFLWFM